MTTITNRVENSVCEGLFMTLLPTHKLLIMPAENRYIFFAVGHERVLFETSSLMLFDVGGSRDA